MSYRRFSMGQMPPSPFSMPTTTVQAALGPHAMRTQPPGTIVSPYGWGPNAPIGMPANYAHHLDYVRTPLPRGTYDQLGIHAIPHRGAAGLAGLAAIAPILAVL